jgi:hypothetical protein
MGVDSLIRKVLEEVGIRKERYDLQWASAAEAPLFVKLITDFTKRMQDLGPIGEAEGLSREEVKERLEKAFDFVSNQKTRISLGNASKVVRKDAVWTIDHIDDVIYTKMNKTIGKAFA